MLLESPSEMRWVHLGFSGQALEPHRLGIIRSKSIQRRGKPRRIRGAGDGGPQRECETLQMKVTGVVQRLGLEQAHFVTDLP